MTSSIVSTSLGSATMMLLTAFAEARDFTLRREILGMARNVARLACQCASNHADEPGLGVIRDLAGADTAILVDIARSEAGDFATALDQHRRSRVRRRQSALL